jgi:pantoate--beta-alanine ligase
MIVIERIEQLRAAIRDFRKLRSNIESMPMNKDRPSVGFVPTMGYLHQGHASLLRRARSGDDIVVLSIFVNPLQFGPSEDFDRYPRNTAGDLQIAEQEGVDIVFMPSVEEMYPQYPLDTRIVVGESASRLCGATRPGHFDGVASIVMKLFNIVTPDHAYFGLKDAQQIAVLRQVTADLNCPVQIIACPIVREKDGLALSSRNVYLTEDERAQAIGLSKALQLADQLIDEGNVHVNQLEQTLVQAIQAIPSAHIDYVSVLTYPSLTPIDPDISIASFMQRHENTEIIVALAVKFGRTRLIDNRIFTITSGGVAHV